MNGKVQRMTLSEFEDGLKASKYTGPVTTHWWKGMKKKVHIPKRPIEIELIEEKISEKIGATQ